MFSRNENRVEFDVFVEAIEFIEKGHDYENVEGDSNGEGDEWIDENGEDTGGRGSENESDDENISGEDSEDESIGEDSGDEFIDYKSDDHCEPNNFSDLEFEDDPLHGSLNRDACTLSRETGQKVKLEKSPFLGFDGCHLKGPFGGVLLAPIRLDGNNGLFPVAFAIVESECKESWTFFFENLSMLVGGFSVDKPWTFMSERQKGLVETINEVVPHAINRRCARHIYANFRSQFAGTALKRYFWQAVRSYSAAGFNFALYKIKELKPAAYEWLLKIPAEMWVWDISGIPCRHATLGISHRREDLDSYCDGRFFKENYMKAYKYSIHPVPDQIFWPHGVDVTPTLLPPIIKRMPGRPKKSRRKEQGEKPNAIRRSNMVKCKICNELGHNRTTCPNIQVQNSGRDSDLHVPLSKLAIKRKTPPLAGRKRKAAVISSSQPPAPAQVSSSQPLLRKDPVVPSMHAAGSSS
ncbi:hypothetical protein Sango_0030100 [Sesamum angolense]|uniref:MULE transposase domain-containing protein n=1 Tax=Sesamum angolense TaxID=2727404 RepID=A0AAE1XCT8_9LAMI|nr:hypothetical protein Sango_0030100 [Sesamum angolense]